MNSNLISASELARYILQAQLLLQLYATSTTSPRSHILYRLSNQHTDFGASYVPFLTTSRKKARVRTGRTTRVVPQTLLTVHLPTLRPTHRIGVPHNIPQPWHPIGSNRSDTNGPSPAITKLCKTIQILPHPTLITYLSL